MRHTTIGTGVLAFTVVLGCVGTVSAGPYSDDLGKCLVKATNADDKSMLVRWIFSVAALHPAVSSVSAVTDDQRTALTKSTAALFESLLTERCKSQAQEALRYEGVVTLQTSFGLLGQAAMMELFANEAVAAGLADLESHIDAEKLKQMLGEGAPQGE